MAPKYVERLSLPFRDVQVHPSDERIAAVILEIADFMLEFSTLGHEEAADIPQFVHPRIPNEVYSLFSFLPMTARML